MKYKPKKPIQARAVSQHGFVCFVWHQLITKLVAVFTRTNKAFDGGRGPERSDHAG